jgi:hypothetical protein
VAFGVDAFSFGRGAEQASDVGEAVVLGLLREGAVFLVGLAFAGEGFLQVIGGAQGIQLLLSVNGERVCVRVAGVHAAEGHPALFVRGRSVTCRRTKAFALRAAG